MALHHATPTGHPGRHRVNPMRLLDKPVLGEAGAGLGVPPLSEPADGDA
jgi:hypothetical protein